LNVFVENQNIKKLGALQVPSFFGFKSSFILVQKHQEFHDLDNDRNLDKRDEGGVIHRN